MKKFIQLIRVTLLLFILTSSLSSAQNIQWQNTIGNTDWDQLRSLQQTSDGGYILGGSSRSNIGGDKTENSNGESDFWIVKTDALGIIQWQNTIGGSGNDYLKSLQQTADGGYILGGMSHSNSSGDKTENCQGGSDYWIVKTDGAGNIQWQNTIGGLGDDHLMQIRQTSDGGFIIGGYSASNISGDKTENSNGLDDYWIVKTNVSGIIQWQNTIGGMENDWLLSIEQTTDGGYILGGSSLSNISGDKTENRIGNSWDYWIIKTNSTGTIQWQNTIGGLALDRLYSIEQTSDGGYIVAGYSLSNISGDKSENCIGNTDYWLVKTDVSGTIQWQNTIGGTGFDFLSYANETTDGGYILGGYANSNISGDKTENSMGGDDYWIIKTSATGTIQWQNTIGGGGTDWFFTLQQTSDGGYLVGGASSSGMNGDKTESHMGGDDYWMVKISSCAVSAAGTVLQNVPCNGGCNGSAYANATGGSSPYTYSWIGTGQTTQTATGLCAGNYTVTVTDANGCAASATVLVTQPSPLILTFSSTNATCFSCSNGSASVSVSGGAGPYTYLWTPGGTTSATISNRLPGNYTCCVTDANGCSTCSTVTINYNCTTPTLQAKNISFSNVTSNSMRVSWTNGNGARRIVKIKNANTFINPVTGTDYSANTVYSGSEQVVYNGTGNNVTVTGLAPNTTYWFRVYEANCSGSSSLYRTSTATNNPNKKKSSAAHRIAPENDDDISQQQEMIIYPNPGRDFTISLDNRSVNLPCRVQIFDLTGKVLLQQNLNQQSTYIQNDLVAGIYFVRVSDGEKTFSLKLMIEK
jgi:hypothetical protein